MVRCSEHFREPLRSRENKQLHKELRRVSWWWLQTPGLCPQPPTVLSASAASRNYSEVKTDSHPLNELSPHLALSVCVCKNRWFSAWCPESSPIFAEPQTSDEPQSEVLRFRSSQSYEHCRLPVCQLPLWKRQTLSSGTCHPLLHPPLGTYLKAYVPFPHNCSLNQTSSFCN